MNKQLAFVIEDEPDLATIFSEALLSVGFETKIITFGDVAIKELETSVPAVVVLDLHIPRLAGTEVLKYIRSDERLKDVKVIIATADAALAESIEKKADLVLLKPISFLQLRTLAERLKTTFE
ncbi:MAG: response regulator [Anaerolineae bacterium]|jgi:CheY-like chemotaxis protein|nr:response regulator [Anaerolineae bacterium]